MDMLAEELEVSGKGFRIDDQLIIAVLLWVDDVVSCVDGLKNQEEILKKVHEFSLKHRLKWGQSKCQVMRVGKHVDKPKDWDLGELKIHETTSYKYLGDVISSDGKNGKNLESRKNKTQVTTVTVNSIAASEVLRGIETSVLTELHEKVTIPGLLANAESWSLNRGEKVELERTEIQALKYLFDLPTHTPTPAILYSLGTLYTNQRVDQKRLNYLHRILQRNNDHWTNRTLLTLHHLNIGWGKSINEALSEYNLPTDFTEIKNKSVRQWKQIVAQKIEVMNTKRLYQDCHKTESGTQVPKTKTAHIVPSLSYDTYRRKLQDDIIQCTKYETKAIIIARFGMLECGWNYKGSIPETCAQCNQIDDENHRLNYCIRFRETNLYDTDEKVDFSEIFSTDINTLRNILPKIEGVWNMKNAHGTMVK